MGGRTKYVPGLFVVAEGDAIYEDTIDVSEFRSKLKFLTEVTSVLPRGAGQMSVEDAWKIYLEGHVGEPLRVVGAALSVRLD